MKGEGDSNLNITVVVTVVVVIDFIVVLQLGFPGRQRSGSFFIFPTVFQLINPPPEL